MGTPTTNKALILPTVAGESGTWGTDLNNNTITPLDLMLGGVDSVSLSSTTYTLSSTEIRNVGVKCSGTLLANVLVYSGNIGFYYVENNCTGSYTLTWQANFGSGGVGTGWVIPQGVRTLFMSDTTAGARPCPTWLPAFLAAQSGAVPLTTRRTENDTTLRKALSIQSGSGSGNDYSINETGDGSNNVATVTEQIGSTVIDTKTATTRTLPFPLTLAENATPAAPAASNINLYGYTGDFLASQTPGGLQYLYGKDPTVQRFISGSTYTPTVGTVRIRVRIVGGGGGGGGSTGAGGVGGTTTFGSWTAIGGGGGANTSSHTPGTGGTGGTNGTGTLVVRAPGAPGGTGAPNTFGLTAGGGNSGGGLGAGGAGIVSAAGVSGNNGTGYGGGGGAGNGSNTSGGGGAGAEYCEFYISLPSTITYTVGAGGTAGTGTDAGGTGSGGIVIIEEFYN